MEDYVSKELADRIAMSRRYRNVFGTNEGKLVLIDILNTLGYFSCNISTPGGMETRNAATRIMHHLCGEKPNLAIQVMLNAVLDKKLDD